MALPDPQVMMRRLLERLLRQAKAAVLPQIKQQQLRNGLKIIVRTERPEGELYIPHYWAFYVHEDRGPFGPRKGSGAQCLVWFANPKDDPRLQREIVRYSDWRRLTREEFLAGLEENQRRKPDVYMYVRKYKRNSREGDHFFDRGMEAFEETVPTQVLDAVVDYAAKLSNAVTPRGRLKPILAKIKTR